MLSAFQWGQVQVDYKKIEPLLKEMESMQGVIDQGLHKAGNS